MNASEIASVLERAAERIQNQADASDDGQLENIAVVLRMLAAEFERDWMLS